MATRAIALRKISGFRKGDAWRLARPTHGDSRVFLRELPNFLKLAAEYEPRLAPPL